MKLIHCRHDYSVACRFNLVECVFDSVIGFFRLSKLADTAHQILFVLYIKLCLFGKNFVKHAAFYACSNNCAAVGKVKAFHDGFTEVFAAVQACGKCVCVTNSIERGSLLFDAVEYITLQPVRLFKRSYPTGKLNADLLNRELKQYLRKNSFDLFLVKLKAVDGHDRDIVFGGKLTTQFSCGLAFRLGAVQKHDKRLVQLL